MLINNIERESHSTHSEVKAMLGPYPVWFRHNSLPARVNDADASPFVISALIPAMLLGEDIEVHHAYTVSAKLLNSIPQIQSIYNCWNPIFKKINIHANSESKADSGSGSAAFFSAGVDSIYTACQHQDDLDALILINGFDFNMASPAWQNLVARNRELSELLSKQLVLVETNLKEFTSWFKMKRYANFGATLATIANLLNYKKAYISSHGTYEKILQAGSHPLLDPLWSTESCTLFHTGLEADRTAKITLFKDSPEILSRLWVCWTTPGTNCGRCSKCVRSYIAMQLCGVDNFKFESPVGITQIKKLVIDDENMLSFFEHFRNDALAQNRQRLLSALNRIIFRYKLRRFLVDVDTHLLGSRLKKLKYLGKSPTSSYSDITVEPRKSDQAMLNELLEFHGKLSKVESTAVIGTAFEAEHSD